MTAAATAKTLPAQRDLKLDALSLRVAEELDTLAALSAEVQGALSKCHFADHTDPSAIRGLQGIDRITQSLEDIARLMAAVAQEVPAGIGLPAAPIMSRVRLHELVHNLDPAAGPVHRAGADGDVTWF